MWSSSDPLCAGGDKAKRGHKARVSGVKAKKKKEKVQGKVAGSVISTLREMRAAKECVYMYIYMYTSLSITCMCIYIYKNMLRESERERGTQIER